MATARRTAAPRKASANTAAAKRPRVKVRSSASTALRKPVRTSARSPAGGVQPPLYLRIATELKSAISAGRYPVGARLPTEAELCEQFGISRFTAREAVRVLSAAGLITRRQRVGTVVAALPQDARYQHDAATVRDLFKYAQDTKLEFLSIGKRALPAAQAKEFGVKAGAPWIYATGIRAEARTGAGIAGAVPRKAGHANAPRNMQSARPICITRLFLNPVLKGIEARLRTCKGAVYALIESEYKVSIQRVEQELHGVALSAEDAASLGARAGAPALRIVRRYYSERGELLEVADNIHPADRFSYRMELRK